MVTLFPRASYLTADVTNSISADGNEYYPINHFQSKLPKESKIQKRNRIALKKNKDSWSIIDHKTPKVKVFVKSYTPINKQTKIYSR
jgi:hypothetical protein